MNNKHKYHAQMCLIPQCPPKAMAACQQQIAFRFTHDPVAADDFLPPYQINPRRALEKNRKCSGWALSFFVTQSQAQRKYEELKAICKNIKETIGTHISTVDLKEDDGLASAPARSGHFDLYEWDSADFSGRGSVVLQLP